MCVCVGVCVQRGENAEIVWCMQTERDGGYPNLNK